MIHRFCLNSGFRGSASSVAFKSAGFWNFRRIQNARWREFALRPWLLRMTKQFQLPCVCNSSLAFSAVSAKDARAAQHNTTQHDTTQLNSTRHRTTQHNTTRHNTTQHNTTQHTCRKRAHKHTQHADTHTQTTHSPDTGADTSADTAQTHTGDPLGCRCPHGPAVDPSVAPGGQMHCGSIKDTGKPNTRISSSLIFVFAEF